MAFAYVEPGGEVPNAQIWIPSQDEDQSAPIASRERNVTAEMVCTVLK